MSLENRIVLVTGAARGIGEGIARCFANEGAIVTITDLDQEMVETTATAMSGKVTGVVANAASHDDMSACIGRIVEEHGRFDILVNNAGIGGPKIEFDEISSGASPVASMTDEAWDEQLMYNLRTTFSSSRAAMPYLGEGGSIINIASIAALGPATTLPAYGAAKAGVVHLTKTLSMELAPRRIRVNCICPGLLWTRAWELLTVQMKATQPELANMTQRQIFESVVQEITPLGGEQTPEDIGNLAVFYASDKARMITGQVVAVDGGISVK